MNRALYEADPERRAMLDAEAEHVCTAREDPWGQSDYYALENGHGRELAAGSLESLRAAARLLGVELAYVWHYLPERVVHPPAPILPGYVITAEQP